MAIRIEKEDSELHDNMVRKVKSWLDSNNPGCYVVINPGQEKNQAIKRNGKDVYPDVVYRSKRDEDVSRLYEVETSDSVNETEATQWRVYNAGKSNFYLVVPEESLSKTKALIKEIAGFYTYNANMNIKKG